MTHIFPFGKHKGKPIDLVCIEDPEYLLWLNGTLVNKFSLSSDGKSILDKIKLENQETIEKVKEYIIVNKSKIRQILDNMKAVSLSKAIKSLQSRNYHYHPYGKRD